MKIIQLFSFLILFYILQLSSLASEPFKIVKVNTYLPIIALTFDDGPHPKNTPKILEILNQSNVKATFFCVGNQIKNFKPIIQKISDYGHELGNHSFTHKENKKINVEQKLNEIIISQKEFFNSTKTYPIFYRPPYGTISKFDEVLFSKYFYKTILWNIDSKDWKKNISKEKIIENVISKLRNGSIILCHDTNSKTVSAIPEIIKIAKEKGYKFVTISELLKHQQIKVDQTPN